MCNFSLSHLLMIPLKRVLFHSLAFRFRPRDICPPAGIEDSSITPSLSKDPSFGLLAKMGISFPICPKTYFPSIWICNLPRMKQVGRI
jgi:hypothetical protein